MATEFFSEMDEGKDIVNSRIVAASFFENLYLFLKQTEVHDSSNKIFDLCLENLLRSIENLRRFPGFEEIEVTFRGEQIYINSTRIHLKARQFRNHRFLLRFMRMRRLGALRIPRDVPPPALRRFLWAVAGVKFNDDNPVKSIEEVLKEEGISGFTVQAIQGFQELDSDDRAKLADMELVALLLHEKLREFSSTCFDNLGNAAQFELGDYRAPIRDLVNRSEDDLFQIFRSNLTKRKDRPLGNIAADTCIAAIAWGRSLGIPSGVLAELAGAALSHPLIYVVREKILPGPLTKDELVKLIEIRQSLNEVWPLSDLQNLALLEWTMPFGGQGVYEWEGIKCYPHFFSRMVRILAYFKILTQYQKGSDLYLPDEAMSKMLSSPGEFDPTLLKLFINWMGIYPIGTFVKLRSGEIAQVFAAGTDPLKFQRPIVNLLKTGDGKLLDRPRLVDLSEMNEKLGIYKRSILKSLQPREAGIPDELLKVPPIGL